IKIGTAVPALRTLLDKEDPYALALTTLVLEQAIVDRLYLTDPPTPLVGPAEADLPELLDVLRSLGEKALNAKGEPDRAVWRVRLRCALADASLDRARVAGKPASVDDAYGPLIADASA